MADGEVIPADWRDVIRSDRGWKGNTMIGNNLNELVFLKMGGELLRNAPMIAAQLLGDNGEYAEKAYRALTGGKLMLDEEREGRLGQGAFRLHVPHPWRPASGRSSPPAGRRCTPTPSTSRRPTTPRTR